jgi:hypothetical protein
MRKLFALIGASVLLVPCARVFAQGEVADPSCKPVQTAMDAMARTDRYHAAGTRTSKGKANPTEEIYVGDTLYKGVASRWSRIAVTPQDRIDAGKEVGLTMHGCRTVGNEPVNGEAAVVYVTQSDVKQPKIHTDSRIWISTKSGLPLRVESDAGSASSKIHVSNLYTYGAGVRAPAGS